MGYDWKDTIRDKMSGYTETEPEGLLQNIMKELDPPPATLKQNVSGKKLFIRLAGIGSAVAASIALLATLRHSAPSDSEDSIISVVQTDTNGQIAEVAAKHGVYKEAAHEAPVYYKTYENTQATAKKETVVKNNDPEESPAISEEVTQTENKRNTAKNTSTYTDKSSTRKHTSQNIKEEWTNDFPDDETVYKKDKKLSTEIFYSNLAGSASKAGGYSTMRQIGGSAFNGIPDRKFISATPGEGTMLLTSGEHSNTSVRHRQPVRIGASFRYNFTKCWSIETGLVYSFLSSRMETNESQYKSTTEQKLHYIGIPVKINWSFLNRQHFSLYLNAGGMMEKCIGGNAATEYILNGNRISSTKDNISIKPIQWSVNAAAGVQWNISNHIGIYAEPGISYHFDDGSPISTAYKERPLNFNIEIGLRFSFE